MKNTPLVSVLIPCYNHEKYIYDTIQSILNQTYTNIEVLVSDDCSTDNSVEEIKRIKDPRVKTFFFPENHGTVYGLNFLVKQANGQYIATIGSDDFFAPDKLEKQMQAFKENPSLGAVLTWAQVVDENDAPYPGNDFNVNVFNEENRTQAEWLRFFFHNGNRLCQPSALIKSSAHKDVGLYRASYRQLHDFDFWVRLLLKYPIHIIPETLTYYRRENRCHSVSAPSPKNSIRTFNEYSSIFLWLFKNIDDDLFIEAFGDLLGSEKIKDDREMMIEKYKVLRRFSVENYAIRNASTQFFVDCLDASDSFSSNPDDLNGLISDFHEDNAQFAIDYPNLVEDLRKQAVRIAELEAALDNLFSSKSWKLTKPLRGSIELFKRIFHRR